MKSAVELNRLFLKFILLCQVKIHKSYCENIAKFNFLGIICESDSPTILGSAFYQAFKGPKIQNFLEPGCHLRDMLGLLQTFRFELLGGWNVCHTDFWAQNSDF